MGRILKWLDAVLGVTDESFEDRISRGFWGMLLPIIPLWYGVSSVMNRSSIIIGRHGWAKLAGTAALIAGLQYICVAFLIHVHVVWDGHPQLGGVADAARGFLLVCLLGAILSLFVAILI